RAVVLAAGVFMNAVLAVVLFAAIGMIWGRPTSPPPVVGGVVEAWLPDGARPLMDIPAGTRIVAVGDRRVETMDQVSRTIMAAHAGELTFRLEGLDPVTITIPEAARERQLL